MSRVNVSAEVTVYQDDESEWGKSAARIFVGTYWNDDSGDYATLEIDGKHYTVVARDLRVALDAVTRR